MRNNRNAKIREQLNRLGRPTPDTLDREIARQDRKQAYRRLMCRIFLGMLAAAAAVVLVTNLWLSVLQVDGSSMNPLLQRDEIVLTVNTSNPAKNDVIAFYHGSKIYIKRVIATGGDTVDIAQDGRVTVNGMALDEPYVSELSLGSGDVAFPFQVPTGTVFVLGDDRPASIDSRSSQIGTIDRARIIGRVTWRLWPLSRTGRV